MSLTTGIGKEGLGMIFLLFLLAQRKMKRHTEKKRERAECEAKCEAKRIIGDRYEQPEGSGKAPMEPKTTFMQVIKDMLASQWTMSQSLAQVVDRLARVGTPDTQAPHAA
jgi:hypothetical protein